LPRRAKQADRATDQAEGEDAGPRAFWSGVITFGLVSVPVDLHPAVRSQNVRLRMLAPDGTPLERRYRCSDDETILDGDDIVRGYDTGDGFVTVEDEELAALAPKKSREIDLKRFVRADQIPLAYFNRAYFLVPSGDTNKAYRLLSATMEETGLAGIATFVMRGREYLVALVADSGVLVAHTLRFADELRSADDVGLPERPEVDAAAVESWMELIAKNKKKLTAKKLEDRNDELRRLADKKLKKGEDVIEAPEDVEEERETDNVVDLMRLLKEQLGESDARPGRRRERMPVSHRRPIKKRGRQEPQRTKTGRSKSGRKKAPPRKRAAG
jgi:DNA end-binding protein Ku